jgi:hypothetical protein
MAQIRTLLKVALLKVISASSHGVASPASNSQV